MPSQAFNRTIQVAFDFAIIYLPTIVMYPSRYYGTHIKALFFEPAALRKSNMKAILSG